tara:strand:- start:182 stop:529 length:348 start_codon:yes stop_codon:yes gene_type:complete
MIATSTTTAKATARAVRLWIEGAKLTAAGFNPDTTYKLWERNITSQLWERNITSQRRIILIVSNNGERRVTKAMRNGKPRPIIDLHSKEVAEIFPAGTKVRVEYHPNKIIFTEES